ncbi:MAG TPA: M1 family aminopeptidase [Gemmatimonadaceae bacterium]|nr:M1 family aminopeptidase [Gemmatimonadaceae bacterium]
MRLFPAERRIEVSGAFDGAAADRSRDELTLLLGARFADLSVDVVAPSASAGPAVVEHIPSSQKPRVEGESADEKWRVRPTHPIPAGEPVKLRFSARGTGETAFLYHIGPDVAFATGWGDAWYPRIDREGAERAGELTVRVPAGWRVVTGIRLTSSAEEQAQGIFRFTQTLPAYFTFVAGPYTVVSHGGPVPVTAWLLSPRPRIDSLLSGAESMLGVLTAEFGPYAFDTLALVEVPRPLAKEAGFNAFSPRGMLVLNHRALDAPDAKYEYEWLGHEMSHQWFPHALIWDRPGFLYLEEAIAEYGGIRIVEKLGGAAAARRLRMEGYEFDPIYSAAAYFRLVAAGADEPLSGMTAGINQRNLAYNKGALVLDMLSREMGEREFQTMIHELRGPAPKTITWADFTKGASRAAGRDLGWFFDQWLNRAGAPDFQLTWKQEGGRITATITQPEPTYRVHLTLESRGRGGQRARNVVEVMGSSFTVELSPAFVVEDLVLDPEYEVLRWTPAYRAMVDSLRRRPPS